MAEAGGASSAQFVAKQSSIVARRAFQGADVCPRKLNEGHDRRPLDAFYVSLG